MGDGAPYGRDYADPESPRPDGFFVSQNPSHRRRGNEQLRPPSFGGGYAPPPPPAPAMGLPGGFGMGGIGAGVSGLQGGFGAGVPSRIPGPPAYAGGQVDHDEPSVPPMMQHQPPSEPAAPAIRQPLFPSVAPQIATRPPLDTSRLSRESSMPSDGWGGRRSADSLEHGRENGPERAHVAPNANQSPNASGEGWEGEVPPSYGQSTQPTYPSHLEPPAMTQIEQVDAPPQSQDFTGYPVQRDHAAPGYQSQEFGGRSENILPQEYTAADLQEPEESGQHLAPTDRHEQLPSSRRKPPPAIAKESPLKALYAKGAENYDGNRRKINLTKMMDSMATNKTGEAMTGAQQYDEPYPSSGADKQQVSGQYQESPSDYPSEYPSEYPSAATEQFGGYGDSKHPPDYPQTDYPAEPASYPPSIGAGEYGQGGDQRGESGGSHPHHSYGMPASIQGSSGGLAPENAYQSTHDQRWKEHQQQGVEQDSVDAAGPRNPRLGHMYQPAMNPGSPGGGLNPSPPAFNQPKPFVPGHLQGQGPDQKQQSDQQSQPIAEEAGKLSNRGAVKDRKKKRIFFLRPFSFFYQLVIIGCLVLNPSWAVTKVAVVGALLQASAAGYAGLDPSEFKSLVSRQFPSTHRVHAYESTIEGVFSLVNRASEDAWTMTTAKVPCASSSMACIWARKALHAGVTAGLTSQRSTLTFYKMTPSVIGQLGSLASGTKAFLLDAGTWKLVGLRSNAVNVSKATADYAVCLSKNLWHVSSFLDVMDVAIECGSTSYDAMLSVTDDTMSDHTEDGRENQLNEMFEVEREDEGDDSDDYDDPYAQLNDVPAMANATIVAGDEGEPVEEEALDHGDRLHDSAEDAQWEKELVEELDPVDEPEDVIAEPEAAIVEPEAAIVEPEAVIDEPEAAIVEPEAAIVEPEAAIVEPEAMIDESEPVIDETEVIKDPDPGSEVLDVQAADESPEPVEPDMSDEEELPGPIAPDEIPPMSDDIPEDVTGYDLPEPIVVEPEVIMEGVPPIVTEEGAEAISEQVAADDYLLQTETREEIQARAQRIIDHEKKLSDRKKRRERREDVAPGDPEDLRSVLSEQVGETTPPPAPSTPPMPSPSYKPLFESLIEIVRTNMTHIITAIVSALVASSFFVLQAIRSSGSRLSLSTLADMFGGIPHTPRVAIRKSRRAINDDVEETEDERPTVYKSATSRGRSRRSAVIDEDDEVSEPEKRTPRSKTPRVGRKSGAKSTAKKLESETASGAPRRSSRRSASRR